MANGRDWPAVSIVTPSYNQGHFIEETIRSVLLQGYPNLEYIICDGGSTDESVAIIKKYEPWLTYWVSEPDQGQAHAINKGFELASGEIYGYLNSDDILLPGALVNMSALAKVHPDAVAWIGACKITAQSGRVLEVVKPRNASLAGIKNWYYEGFFYQPAAFFSAKAFKLAGPLDESLHIAMDLDLWLKLAKIGSVATTDDFWAAAKRHPDMKTRAQRNRLHAEVISVLYNAGYHEAAQLRLENLFEDESTLRRVGRKYLKRIKGRIAP